MSLGSRVLAAVVAAGVVVAMVPVAASAATTHQVTVKCATGAGYQVVTGVDAKAGDTLVVSYSNCGFMEIMGAYASEARGDAVKSPTRPSDYTLMGTGTVTLPITATGASGSSIGYFSPGATSSTDQAYVVFGASPSGSSRPGTEDSPSRGQAPLALPRIVGTPKVGSDLRAHPGRWSFRPLVWLTTWYRVNDDGSRSLLSKKPIYRVKSGDAGTRIVAHVEVDGRDLLTQYGEAFSKPVRIR